MENIHSSLDSCLFLLPISIHAGVFLRISSEFCFIFLITIIPSSWGSPSLQK